MKYKIECEPFIFYLFVLHGGVNISFRCEFCH